MAQRKAGEIAAELEMTRAALTSDLHELQNRVAPSHWANVATDLARDGGQATVDQLARTVKENPLPTALIAAGIGWILFRQRRPAGAEPDWAEIPLETRSVAQKAEVETIPPAAPHPAPLPRWAEAPEDWKGNTQ